MSAIPITQPKYTTKCLVPDCTKEFTSSPFDVAILGKPDAKVQKFGEALMKHLQERHPEVIRSFTGRLSEFSTLALASMYDCQDPVIQKMANQIRWSIQKFTQRAKITDADIDDRLSRLGVSPDLHEQLRGLLQDMRDVLLEEGKYAPEMPEQSRIIT